MSWMSKWSPQLLSVLRIIVAFLFMEHGTMKLFSFPMAMNPAHAPGSHVPLFSLIGLAGVLEVFGGLLILLGLFTRPVAFILSGEMAIAYFMAHAPNGFWPIVNHGEAAAFYCFVFLYLAAAGAGPWSIDRLISGEKGSATG
ncbi:MAG TPA: DoxX family protein [Mariprofundaceae bacterium]|nr:DoxX family protein [Mariprofundaceae bacterium]